MLAQDLEIRLARRGLDRRAQQVRPVGAVEIFRAGLVQQRIVLEDGQPFEHVGMARGVEELVAPLLVVADPGQVARQLSRRNDVPLVGERGDIVLDRDVEFETLRIQELAHRRGPDRLGYAPAAEPRDRGHRDPVLYVRVAEALRPHDVAIHGDGDGETRDSALVHVRRDQVTGGRGGASVGLGRTFDLPVRGTIALGDQGAGAANDGRELEVECPANRSIQARRAAAHECLPQMEFESD